MFTGRGRTVAEGSATHTQDYEWYSFRPAVTFARQSQEIASCASLSAVAVIHVLEDDPGVSDSLRSLLQALGLTVAQYRDGESFMSAPPPDEDDVVIVDLGLPGVGGAQVVRWIEALDPSPRVIVISGQPQKAIDDALLGSGIRHVLRKPLSGDALTSLLMS